MTGLEVVARDAAVADGERVPPTAVDTRVFKAGDIELDRASHRVRRNGHLLHLGPTEFRLLEFLMLSQGRVFSRAELLDGVWGGNLPIGERTVDVHVGRLRKCLGAGRNPIRTVRGAGYSFDETFAAGAL